MLDFPELFAPARMVRGLISIDWRRAIDLYPQTPIWVKPGEFDNPLDFFEFDWWFILDHPYDNLYQETLAKCKCTTPHYPMTGETAPHLSGTDANPHEPSFRMGQAQGVLSALGPE
jgi:hypothetical protein